MFELIRANRRRSAVLVLVMGVMLLLTGFFASEIAASGSGPLGAFMAVAVWAFMTVVSYYAGDRIVLALARAREISAAEHPVLHNVVEEMCVASGTASKPAIYIIDDDAPNAFATGRDPEHASVAVTSGLLKLLDRDELQGVIAHEIAHVRNRDILYMMMVAVMMGVIVLAGDFSRRLLFYGGRSRTSSRSRGGNGQVIILLLGVLFIILAPFIAQLIYLAISRRREYLADACGAQYSRYPEGLASALEKIGRWPHPVRTASKATAPMYFVNPFRAGAESLSALTATHPPLAERIAVLRAMGGRSDLRSYDDAFRRVSGRPVGVVPFSGRSAPPAEAAPPPPPPITVSGLAIGGLASLADRPPAEAIAHTARVRHTTDLLWNRNGYRSIECACGTKLKIPPVHQHRRIECPHCSRVVE